MNDLIALIVSGIIVCLIGCPLVNWIDKTKKEMDREDGYDGGAE